MLAIRIVLALFAFFFGVSAYTTGLDKNIASLAEKLFYVVLVALIVSLLLKEKKPSSNK